MTLGSDLDAGLLRTCTAQEKTTLHQALSLVVVLL